MSRILDQVGALVTIAVERFGGLDVMVNNAGVSGTMHRRFLDDDLADFDRVMRVNVLGVMAGTRDAARHMATAGGGSIINMTSIGGIQAGGGVMTYRASKAAVIQFTKSAAIELAHYEIRVNAIAPGNIPTPFVASSATAMDQEQIERYEAKIRETMRADRPLKREGTPHDVAEAALYFAERPIAVRHRNGAAGGRWGIRGQADPSRVRQQSTDRPDGLGAGQRRPLGPRQNRVTVCRADAN